MLFRSGAERLEELGGRLQERQRELTRSGGMRLMARLKRATLRLT